MRKPTRHTRPQEATEEIRDDYFKEDEEQGDKFVGGLFTLLVMPIATVVIIKLTFVLTDCEPPRPPPLLALSPLHAPGDDASVAATLLNWYHLAAQATVLWRN